MDPFGEPTGAPKGAKVTHFRALWGDKWKCENYASVGAESLFLRLEGVLRDLICITSGPLVLSMRFGRHFLPKFPDVGILSEHFWLTFGLLFQGLILGLILVLLGGAGGRGWVPVASESAESDLRV